MKNTKSLQTLVTLANASELVCGIAQEVLGNDVADAINGSPLSNEAIRSLALAQFQQQQSIHRGSV